MRKNKAMDKKRKYWIEILKWNGDEDGEPVRFDTLAEAEWAVKAAFGPGAEWLDTQMGFQVVAKDSDFDMLFARGGPILWEISLMGEQGIEEWNDEIIEEHCK
jgi:hypothetical protein